MPRTGLPHEATPTADIIRPSTQRRRLRNAVFTMNNPTRSGQELFEHLSSNSGVKYCVFQLERGESGTPHFQGYVEMHNPTEFSTLRAMLPYSHIEPRRGTAKQAADYCKKADSRISEDYWEYGEMTRQGKRQDLTSFREAILAGMSTKDLSADFTNEVAKYERFMHLVRRTQTPEIRSELQVELHWGSTGTGKSFQAYRQYPDLWATPATDQMWFDGYDGQETVLIEEFGGQMKLDLLLRVLDQYPLQVPVKGSFVWFRPKRIIVTSNSHPFQWYKWEGRERKCFALLRRFTKIWEYGGVSQPICPVSENYLREFERTRFQTDRVNVLPRDATQDPPTFLDFSVSRNESIVINHVE